MNHLLQSICPEEENARPKTCYFVIGETAIRMFAREKELLAKGSTNERVGNAPSNHAWRGFEWTTYRQKRQTARPSEAPLAALYRSLGFRLSATRNTSNGMDCLSNARFRLRATSPQSSSRWHASCTSCGKRLKATRATCSTLGQSSHTRSASPCFWRPGNRKATPLSAASHLPSLGAQAA